MVEQFNYLMEHHEAGCDERGCQDCARFDKVREVLLDVFKFRQYRMRPLRSIALAAFVLGALAGVARCQELTQEERWASELAVYHSQDWLSWWQKMPVDAALPVVPPLLEILPSEPVDGSGGGGPLPVRLVSWQGSVTSQPRMAISISPGREIGRGVWSWRATAENLTDAPQNVDQGDIETAANSVGIPVIGFGEAQASNQLAIHTSKPVRGAQIVGALSGAGLTLMATRAVSASSAWGIVAAVGFYGADKLMAYFRSITPADLGTRFSGTEILKDGTSKALAPRGSPGHSATWEFFARYSGKNAIARSGIPMY